GESYDIAVSYIQGQTARFVADNVKADRKIVFYHGSTDARHDLHEAVFPCYDRIVAVNEGCARILGELYPSQADKITFIENFVDPDEVREKAKEYEPPRHEGKTVLCSCGRFTEEKGFDLALEAAAELKNNKMPFVWYFIGDGKLRGDLEKQRDALGLTDGIVFTGMLENPYTYIAGCDIYVQPSYEESQGLAAAEAQILLRPVAATDTVGARSMIRDGETGLISRTDAASLAGAIIKLHEDRGLYEKIVNDLKNVDHKEKEEVFRAAWRDLLSFDRG
ncbi:MAG: glycosyltransferase, partial [Clostridia bacterium]|nr:glycosyltransferase [Clostridia bacterium]